MEYSNIQNIKIIVELLKNNQIKNLVISPGGTNIPIIKAVQDDPFFRCFSVVDERSAAYFAIGLYIQIGEPIVLICTSAQATRNYIPGLTEAYYKKCPILAITMEKHPRFKYQEYMQAPDQTSLPNDAIKKSFELPFVADINDYYYSVRLVNQAINELSHNGFGPVQLCVPWLDFPLPDCEPQIRTIKCQKDKDVESLDLADKKILIVIGEHRPFSSVERQAIDYFCENTNTVIYVNHLSNFSNKYSLNANLLLSTITDEELKNIQPDIMISIGGQTGDYPFYLAFSKNILENVEHWRICEDGEIVDTYDKLTRVFQGSIVEFFSSFSAKPIKHDYYAFWENELSKKSVDLDVPFSNVFVAQYCHEKIPKNSIVQFSILNSLRVWNLFELDPSIECYSNVGAFGIDGGMSTLIGQSVVTHRKAFMIIGDLAFFYDINSLGIRHIKNNLRILLINNNGGMEFKLGRGEDKSIDRFIAASGHFKDAKGWASTCGFKYLSANNKDEFEYNIDTFINDSDVPIIFECFVSDTDENSAYQTIINNNRNKSTSVQIKEGIKKSFKGLIGEKGYTRLKKKIK